MKIAVLAVRNYNFLIIGTFLMSGLLFACDNEGDNPVTKLNLDFELKYDGEFLSGSSELYEINDSVKMRFSKVSFYLSDFVLTSGAERIQLLDVLHISFLQNINGDAIQEMKQTLSFEVPSGDYSSLAFGLGLTPAQNSTMPADHGEGALSLSSEYWPAWKSYIYEKLEGSYQVNDGEPQSAALHVGGDETYRVLQWDSGISIGKNKSNTITIPIDLKAILEDYPITESPVLHSLEQLPLMENLADGFAASMNGRG